MSSPENPLNLQSLRLERGETELRYLRSRRRRALLITAVVLVAGLTVLYLVFSGSLLGHTVQVAPVSKIYPSQAVTLLNASGYVVAQRKASVSSKSTGRLVFLGVEEGSRVKKGEIIARLENDDLVATRDRAAANVNAAKAALAQAEAELVDARLQYDRLKTLLAQDLISRQDFDAATARYQKAVAGVASGRSSVSAAAAALEEARTAVEYSLIRAPFDGVVLTKNAEVGEVVAPFGAAVNARAAVATMADMRSLMVEADVAEANIHQVTLGQPCEILLDALPGVRFPGKVHMIVPTADRSKATIMVKVAFTTTDPRVLPEMSAKVAFLSRPLQPDEGQPRLVVNPRAVFQKNGVSQVFVVREQRVEAQVVQLGPQLGDLLEVLSGLQDGDRVVLEPAPNLKSGDRVTIKEG
ncbi:MAG: efflux RND transporter periplasmic adaptor subunit [Desulfobacca sp.]|uniref:efflux RND transporter periplasmic adaptor subunit n=1 Tax=Desulfobacca sp. TaxID=2067990 RepID=UPI00404B8BF5